MHTRFLISIFMLFIIILPGCETPQTKEQAGMIIGGILGGVVGSEIGGGDGRTAAIIVGSLIGSSIGGSVGRSMDETDRLKAAHALETVRTGVPSTWNNPDTGNQYTVVPTKTYETTAGPCREYTMEAWVGGKKEEVFGTACRQADGSWKSQG